LNSVRESIAARTKPTRARLIRFESDRIGW
jgi:hypothetical protein